jgi:hypothetical protein
LFEANRFSGPLVGGCDGLSLQAKPRKIELERSLLVTRQPVGDRED